MSRDSLLQTLDTLASDLQSAMGHQLDRNQQALDLLARRLGRPQGVVAQQGLVLARLSQRLPVAMQTHVQRERTQCDRLETRLQHARDQAIAQARHRLASAAVSLKAMDPSLVLQRGYAWLASDSGLPITHVTQVEVGQRVLAQLADGKIDLNVKGIHAIPDKNS